MRNAIGGDITRHDCTVGVIIEKADLTDLELAIDGTDSVPLARTYQHLLRGSEHHLAAFTRLLAKAGVVLE